MAREPIDVQRTFLARALFGEWTGVINPDMLTARIDALDAEMSALQPEWDVPSLQQSYTRSEVYGALRDIYDAA